MCYAVNHNCSICFNIISSVPLLNSISWSGVEFPISWAIRRSRVESVSWMGRTSLACAAAVNVNLFSLEWGPDGPTYPARSDKEVVVIWPLQFENLPKRIGYIFISSKSVSLPLAPCWSSPCSCTPPHSGLESLWQILSRSVSGSREVMPMWCSRSSLCLLQTFLSAR